MSHTGTPNEIPDALRGLLDQWVSGLAQVVESMADQKPEVQWQPGGAPATDQDLLWWEQPLQVAPGMLLWVAAPHPTWEYAGTLTLKAAGLETVETAEARNTWLEILGQSLSGLARAVGGVLGREVTCEAGAERAPETLPEASASVSMSFGETKLTPLWIGFSPRLVSLVCNPATAIEPEVSPQITEGADERLPAKRCDVPPTMELLLDVELPVSISFGKTEILMKDVLKLTTGSIVELNRGVNEPVEVLVNHCLIARGEVVVVEGNYGVRIQQIVNRQDRLRERAMNVWILFLSLLCGLVLCAAAVSLFVGYRAHRLLAEVDARAQYVRPEKEVDIRPLRESIEALAAQVRDLQSHPPAALPAGAPKSGFNLNKRSQALRMHRRGDAAEQIAASLDLPRQEVELLLKVHRVVIQNV